MKETTNRDQLMFNIYVATRDAERALTRMRDGFKNLFGERFPITEHLNKIHKKLGFNKKKTPFIEKLNNILEDLGFNEMYYLPDDGPDPKPFLEWLSDPHEDVPPPAPFLEWLSDPRGYGRCTACKTSSLQSQGKEITVDTKKLKTAIQRQ